MRIPIDKKLSIPIYQQVTHFLREQIEAGTLSAGTRLPSSRQLARDLNISRITIQNAYLDLEAEGLIFTKEGSGTFVRVPLKTISDDQDLSEENLPSWQKRFQTATKPEPWGTFPPHPGLISFTGVGPAEEFPIRHFMKALKIVADYDGEDAFQYGQLDAGFYPLRERIGQILASQGIRARADNIMICAGSQQALALICQVLLNPGDFILVEDPTYNLALDLFRGSGMKLVGIPVDENGMMVDQVNVLIQKHKPKMIYTIPNFQNPSGASLSVERRRTLLQLAVDHQIPLIEDDFVGDLRFEGRSLPAIKALDPGGQVIYIGTFSKMLMPGLRMGYLVGEGPIFRQLVNTNVISSLTASPLIQRALHEFMTVGRYQIHLRKSKKIYRKRRDALDRALDTHLPEAEYNTPQGGLFCWVKLPGAVNSRTLLPKAQQSGVEYAPGDQFFVNPEDGRKYMRLNFAVLDEEKIDKGVRRLASLI